MNNEDDDEKEVLTPSILYSLYESQFHAVPNPQQFRMFCRNDMEITYKECQQLLQKKNAPRSRKYALDLSSGASKSSIPSLPMSSTSKSSSGIRFISIEVMYFELTYYLQIMYIFVVYSCISTKYVISTLVVSNMMMLSLVVIALTTNTQKMKDPVWH